jgi:hypothetical protein
MDKPSRASRARAVELAGTAGAFVTTTAGAAAAAGAKGGGVAALYKSVALWICIGAIGGGGAALLISELSTPSVHPTPNSTSSPVAPPLVLPEPVVAAPSPEPEPKAAPDISPEPASAAAPKRALPVAPSAEPVVPPLPVAGSGVASFPDPETKQIESARAAVARGDSSGAIQALDSYDATHPNGVLKAESAALRVQAVSNTGNSAKAQTLANEFEKKFPTSPLRGAVRDTVRPK